jgi:FAD/FMN-containing dehydrogenase
LGADKKVPLTIKISSSLPELVLLLVWQLSLSRRVYIRKMATTTARIIANLTEYLTSYPSIKLFTPETPGYKSVRQCFAAHPDREPLAVVRPQSAEDVQALMKFVVANGVEFTVRSGGHDCGGRSQVLNSLMIDLRDIDYVDLDKANSTARVGGGILIGHLADILSEAGLVTPG